MKDATQDQLSRRDVMRLAGGITFFALAPTAALARPFDLADAVPSEENAFKGKLIPVFTAMPYLQGGAAGSQLKDGNESIVIAWQTYATPAEFKLSFGESRPDRQAEVAMIPAQGKGKEFEGRNNYSATLTGLKLGKKHVYRVILNGELLLEGYFTTRKPRGSKIRFVSFGDNSFGDPSDRAIAYQSYQARPDFIMNTGDLVYNAGLDNEFARYFFPVYNADVASRQVGAPLLRSVPLYTVIANHDVEGQDENHHPVADFKKSPDSLGYYSNLYLPSNGPEKPAHPTPVIGDEDVLGRFYRAAGARFPRQANYSFDYGDAHFTCLDSNLYVDPTNPELQAWIESDLSSTDAPWKFVVYHHPAFNVGHEHYEVQHMRVLAPIFQRHGVQIVFSGHEHNYQRTRPLRFTPTDESQAKMTNGKKRLVPGAFEVDRAFDGQSVTKANGIIHITTGAGGKHLYDPEQNGHPGSWLHEEDSNADYVVTMVSDRHSLTVVDIDGAKLTLRQVDEWGSEIDRITLTR